MIDRRTGSAGRVTWRVRWRDPDGSQRSKSFKSQREAKTFDAERVANNTSWVSPSKGTVRLRKIWPQYLNAQAHAKPRTTSGYEQMWRTHIEPEFGAWPIGQIRFSHISSWVADLNKRRSPATTRKAFRVLSLLLDWGVATGVVAKNEGVGVKLPRQTQRPARTADVRQLNALANHVHQSARDLVLFLAYTGMRWGEATALRIGDVDLGRLRINVVRTHIEIGGRLETGTPPKNHKARQVPVIPALASTIEARVQRGSTEKLLFTRPDGGPWRNSNFRRDSQWVYATNRAGLPGFRVHDLRHTAASLMIESGASVADVATVLGHASSHTTLTIYAHLIGARLDDLARKLERTVSSSCVQIASKPKDAGPLQHTTKRGK